MNSKEMGIGAANYIAMGSRIMEIAVQRGTEAGIKAAMDYLTEERKQLKKGRYDRRLRNTRLLLKNYRSFRNYAKNAVYKASQLKENAVDILDGLDEYSFDDSLYIESIKEPATHPHHPEPHRRDAALLQDRLSNQAGRGVRRYRIIVAYYINEQRKAPSK